MRALVSSATARPLRLMLAARCSAAETKVQFKHMEAPRLEKNFYIEGLSHVRPHERAARTRSADARALRAGRAR